MKRVQKPIMMHSEQNISITIITTRVASGDIPMKVGNSWAMLPY